MSAIIHVALSQPCPWCGKEGAQIVGHSQREVNAKITRGEWGPCMKCALKALKAQHRAARAGRPAPEER